MESILLQVINTEQLKELFREELTEFSKSLKPSEDTDELLTRTEAFKLLKIDSSTLYLWTKKGFVTAHGIGNRIYYKRSELLNSLQPLK